MAGRKRNTANEFVMTMRLPSELHQRLLEAAGGRALSEEIRQRLEASLVPDPLRHGTTDTQRLLESIAWLCGTMADAYGPDWRKVAGSVFRGAVTELLNYATDTGEPPEPRQGSTVDRLRREHPPGTPETLGLGLGLSAAIFVGGYL
jgi:hypothetical protein